MSSESPNGGGHKPPIPTPAKKIPAINIDRRGDRLYQIDNLHKWFAISSLLLFFITVAMVLQDYSREWKRYQREFLRLNIERTQQEMNQAASGIDRARFDQLQRQLDQTRAEQGQNENRIAEIQDRLDDLNAQFYGVNQNYQFQKAIYDTQKYEYEESVASRRSNMDRLHAELDENGRKTDAYRAEVERLSIEIREAQSDLDKLAGRRGTIQREIDDMLKEYNRLQIRLDSIDPGMIVTSFRNAPLMDFMAPSLKIEQNILPNLYYDHPFKPIGRVDRCRTCHLGIDQPAFEKTPQPFKTHPNLDTYLAASSPHPLESFGCTSCHSGLDRAVDFQTAGHMPSSAEQRAEWKEKYNWHEEHYLETPMFPMNNVEAGCYKCHNAGVEVPRANALNDGRDLIRIYGCFGCHRIAGYEKVRKAGPDLTAISGKLTKDWAKKWLAAPKQFKSEARMPQFWFNANNSGPQWEKRNVAEINAIVEYLWANSKPRPVAAGPSGGNAADGKAIVESVGCFGCHAIGPIEPNPRQSQTRRMHGYNLASQGSKVTPSWLYNWVKNPRQIWAESKMPSLRLTDREAADVAAYLSSLRNPEFDTKPVPETDMAALDTVALELLRSNSTDIEARDVLRDMTGEEKNLFVGERLVSRYGCFGCHTIPKFEKTQPIGTELTAAGSKLLAQLDFGFLDIEHSRRAWYEQKLKNPRIFDVGRVKRPEELLRMPDFRFSEAEVSSITMVLTSLVKDPVPLEMRHRTSDAVAAGRLLIADKNCKGCHVIEGSGGDIRPTIRQLGFEPPNLATQGLKTQPAWLHPFLKDPSRTKLRSWLTVRMPTFHFTEEEAAAIGRYFSAVDKAEYPFITTSVETTPEKLRAGAELFTRFQCASCHPRGSERPPGKDEADLAPDLLLSHERLRPRWVLDWLADPQKIVSGTRMPSFFPGGVTPLPDVLGGDVQAQIEAIRDHLFVTLGGGQRTPVTATKSK